MRGVQEDADREDREVPRGAPAEERGSEGQGPRFHAEGRALTVLAPVGLVRNGIRASQDFSGVVSEIEIFDEYSDGLYRLDELKEIFVLFVFDRNVEKGFKHILHPKGDESIPFVGVFASRSPFRPNPIGLTKVELLSVNGNILRVKGLDAFEGTPVIDIKPVERRDGNR